MQVALVNYEYGPGAGGGGAFTASLSAALEDRGHDVGLVVDDREHATASARSLLTWPVRSFPAAARAARRADVLNAHFAVPTAPALPPIARATDTPLVVNLMGADVYDPTRFDRVRPLLDAVVNGWVGRAADALIAPSHDMAARLPGDLREKTVEVPYFVDTERFAFGEADPSPPLRLLTVARLVERKRIDRAIRAVAHLHDRGIAAELTVAGSGPERETLERVATQHDVRAAVTFAGYVPDADLPGLYREHDVFVVASEHEAFCIAAAEAMAAGLPVVATETGGHAEVAGEPGEAVAPSAQAVADGAEACRASLRARAHGARERACTRFSAGAVVPRYERLYREVAA